ncbi:hypothetical protein NOC27_2743 [Nitrosococcus oceani AFC27]|nr:hypothetical protein NOC27_2743 [Nitrosococcus oceani AFC27]
MLTTLAALLTGLVGFLLMHRLQTESVQSVRHSLDVWRMTLMCIRWTSITLVALSWKYLIARLVSIGVISHDKVASLTEMRWRAVTWLVLLELVLGQGVLVKTVSLAVGAVP